MRNVLREFKEFAVRGSVIDLAVGVIIGAAFNKIVNSLVNDILLPPIGLLLRRVDFSNLFVNLGGERFGTIADAQKVGAPTLNCGLFINALISFLLTALAVFMVVRAINRFRRREEAKVAPELMACPFCRLDIPKKATRCPHCTSTVSSS